MMRVSNLKGRRITVRQVNPAELSSYQRKRAAEAMRRAENMARSSRYLIAEAGCDVAGFEQHARWYVAKCKAGQEQRIKHELEALNIECWCPLMEMRRRSRRGERRSTYLVPVFNSYVFVRLMPKAESWIGALMASGLSGYIGCEGEPYAVPERLIKLLKMNVKRKPEDDDDLPVRVNDRVDITEGPFFGFQAVVRSILPKHWRVSVDIEIFGRMTLVELELDQIAK